MTARLLFSSRRSPFRQAGRALVAFMLLAGVGACSTFDDASDFDLMAWLDEKPQEGEIQRSSEPPVEELFNRGEAFFDDERYKSAAETFDEVERLYPTSTFAKRAILRSAESYYRARDFDNAALASSRFLDFYPSDEQAAYAQYLLALTHYDQITDVGRDQARTRQALQALRELVNRYPNSDYAREAQIRLDLTMNHLAGKEMTVGRFYLRRREWIGAMNRFRTVVEQYQTTEHVAEALHRLVEVYLSIGATQEAQTTAAVLGHNFPGSNWYRDSYALLSGRNLEPEDSDESWISRVWRQTTTSEGF